MNPAARHLLDAALADLAGPRLLWVGDHLPADLPGGDWLSRTPGEVLTQPWTQRHDLAVAWLPSTLPSLQTLNLVSALRDLHARQLLVFVASGQDAGIGEHALRALALQQQARFEQDGELREAWSYDIRTYKAVPDWLNPRFWANPENWNKYRW